MNVFQGYIKSTGTENLVLWPALAAPLGHSSGMQTPMLHFRVESTGSHSQTRLSNWRTTSEALNPKLSRCGPAPRLNQSSRSGVPNLWDLMSDYLRWSWCTQLPNKCNVLESSWIHHPIPGPGEKKICLPWNQSLVPKRLGTLLYVILMLTELSEA